MGVTVIMAEEDTLLVESLSILKEEQEVFMTRLPLLSGASVSVEFLTVQPSNLIKSSTHKRGDNHEWAWG